MRKIPQVSTLMTAFPWHLDVHESVGRARALMAEKGIHHLPVTNDEHQVLGLVSIDALADVDEPLSDWLQPVPQVDVHTRADEVLELMAETHQSVVIVCHHSRLAGILTWTDVCRHFADHLREPFLPPNGNDVA